MDKLQEISLVALELDALFSFAQSRVKFEILPIKNFFLPVFEWIEILASFNCSATKNHFPTSRQQITSERG